MRVVNITYGFDLDNDLATDDKVEPMSGDHSAAVTDADCKLALVADATGFEPTDRLSPEDSVASAA